MRGGGGRGEEERGGGGRERGVVKGSTTLYDTFFTSFLSATHDKPASLATWRTSDFNN